MKDKKPAKPAAPAAPAQKHSAMKLPAIKSEGAQAPGARSGKSWQNGGGKPHKTPEHLMGKARKVH